MKQIHQLIFLLLIGLGISSCEDFLQPVDNSPITDELLDSDPVYMEGLLLHAYKSLPDKYNYNCDAATDNAVTNVKNSNYLNIAQGAWSSEFNPFNQYDDYFSEIYYINTFLSRYQNVNWSADIQLSSDVNKAIGIGHEKRLKGEAFGLRAYYQLQLLQTVSGVGTNDELLGFPIVTEVIGQDSDFKFPRNSFTECVNQIVADCDSSIKYLPLRYENISGDDIHNKTFGERFLDRMDARGAMAIKADALLLAASPAFNPTNDLARWEEAADAAAGLVNVVNGNLPANGITFYNLATSTSYNSDVIWANSRINRNDYEKENYPPSLNGTGNINPTQNLVDAFPMKTGYPADQDPGYDPLNPYAGRDLRFYEYILADGQTLINPISTYTGADKDGLNNLLTSTRTGYYMKKFLDISARYNPETGGWSNATRSFVHYRYTRMFLNYAEAANEAWGPQDDPRGYGYTAQSILGQIRERAGIPAADPYLKTVVGTDKELFRHLVHNERRIELCFEGSRFWDIRRWEKIAIMNETAKGMNITQNEGTKTYNVIDVEPRLYKAYMIYAPVPYAAVIKSDLIQNKDW